MVDWSAVEMASAEADKGRKTATAKTRARSSLETGAMSNLLVILSIRPIEAGGFKVLEVIRLGGPAISIATSALDPLMTHRYVPRQFASCSGERVAQVVEQLTFNQ